ncbi:serine hydrolase domain-containing protein [Prauserella cavernicola]|uniref:Beta-lactamase family protein n=1 Tax=Prauserella cavernicola TaxID=2800127 RepID=A0A934V496_9PSEU|nr:serine hydrolase domain-containing protein [Prauserella cavernicola]MBK1783358.1 beta-lactamase family protein [Prauserella cavernicola]
MTGLAELLETNVRDGAYPGAVGLLARGDRIESAVAGSAVLGATPMAEDSIFRLASLTKPITAAAVLLLVDDGVLALGDPVARWLPELARPSVVRTPASPVDDVVPADRPITVFDVLSSQAGYGFASDFTLPAVRLLQTVQRDGRQIRSFPEPDVWLAELARVPLLHQPGRGWLYDTCSTLQGVLVSRAAGVSLPEFLAERVFAPLAMTDTGFWVPPSRRERFTAYYRASAPGVFELADAPDGQWSEPPVFPLGNGGLVGTAGDLLAFGRMLLAGGVGPGGRPLLTPESLRLLTTDHTTPSQREFGSLFLDGQGWGFGGSVDITASAPWSVPGRYGWTGGTGTTAYVVPSTGTVSILLTQVAADSPVPFGWLEDFWGFAAAW